MNNSVQIKNVTAESVYSMGQRGKCVERSQVFEPLKFSVYHISQRSTLVKKDNVTSFK